MKSIFVFLVLLAMTAQVLAMEITKQPAGTADGKQVDLYTLSDKKLVVRILTYGGIVQSIDAPDRHGKMANIVQGFDGLSGYVTTGNKPYMGAIIGRYAESHCGRIFQARRQDLQRPQERRRQRAARRH